MYEDHQTLDEAETIVTGEKTANTGDKIVKIPVTEGQALRSGVRTVAGSISAKDLANRYRLPYRDALKKTGYQRKPQDTRINKLMGQLRKNMVDVPTSVLLNLRGSDAGKYVKKSPQGELILSLKPEPEEEDGLFVVDGQHRIKALCRLYKEDPDRWADYRLQFVLLLGADEDEELNQFYIVNSTAKSVRTDLALDLLKQRTDADSRVMEDLIGSGQDWKVSGQAIVEKMYADSPIWSGKIRLANAEKLDTVISSAGFVSSVKPLLKSPYFSALSLDHQTKMIGAYWQGIRSACREPFDNDVSRYALQKGIGATAMHELLVTVIEHVRSAGESVFDEDAYKTIMEPVLAGLEGDNVAGETVAGADFWLTAQHGGAAGSYSSSAGRRVLIAKLKNILPIMKIE